jgi:hypothetical protein
MTKIINRDEWILNADFNKNAVVDVNITVMYPDYKTMLELTPTERKKKISQDLTSKFKALVATHLFESYTLIGTSKKPRGIKTCIPFSYLEKIEESDDEVTVFINKIEGARKKRRQKPLSFFCVKMTVAIEIEGLTKGLQKIEERFVIVKAKSGEEAIEKLEKTKENYSEPYLNSDGRLVHWIIESFDDWYETEISTLKDLEAPDGAEVFSKFKSRRYRDKAN